MVAVADDVGTDIEPKGLGHDLLEAWAPFARDDGEGRESWNVKPRIGKGYWGDPPDEYWIVEKIVAPHRASNNDFWRLVSRRYLGEKDYWLIAKDLDKPEWWVRSILCWATELVRREYLDRTVGY